MKNNFEYTENGIEVDISEAMHCGDKNEEITKESEAAESYAKLLIDIADKQDSE